VKNHLQLLKKEGKTLAACKAVTPIISVILLLLMTIVASAAAYYWMSGLQSDIQGNMQGNLQNEFEEDLREFTLVSTSCDAATNTITLLILNPGSVNINAGDLIITLSSLSGSTLDTVIYSDFNGLGVSETQSIDVISTYDIQSSTVYAVRATIPGGKSSSDSCTGE